MAQQDIITLRVGFRARESAKEIAAPALRAQAMVSDDAERRQRVIEQSRRNAGTLEEKRARQMAAVQRRLQIEEERRERDAVQAVARERDDLAKRRAALVISGIEDERERRLALIDAQYNEERRRIDALLRARLEAGEITREQFRQQLAEFDQLLDRSRQMRVGELEERFGGAMQTLTTESRRADMAVFSVARSIDSASRFTSGWQSGVRGLSYQFIPLISNFRRLQHEQKGAQSLMQGLLGAFKGPAGWIALLTLATTAAVLFGRRIMAAFGAAQEAAEDAKQAFNEALDSVLTFGSSGERFVVQTEQQARALVTAARAEEDALKETLGQLQGERARVQAEHLRVLDAGARLSDEQRAQRRAALESINQELARVRREMGEVEGILDRGRSAIQRFGTEARVTARLAGMPGVERVDPDAERRDTDRLARQAQQERLRREREFAQTVAALRLEIMGRQIDRELEEVRRQEDERLAIVRGNAEAEELVRATSALRRLAVETQARQREEAIARQRLDAEAAVEERLALLAAETEQERQAVRDRFLEARIERLRAAEEAAEQSAAAVLAEMQQLGQEESDLYDELLERVEQLRSQREAAELAASEAAATRRQRERSEEEQFVRAMADLRLRERLVQGESQEALTRERLDQIRLELATVEDGSQRKRELLMEEYQLQIELQDLAARRQAELMQQAERFARGMLDAITAAVSHERRLSDAQVRENERRLLDREEALRASLDRQEITQAEFNDRMALLAEERSAFERQVAEDQASAIARISVALTQMLREAAIDAIKAYLAKAAAAQVEKVMSSPIPFPLNIAMVGGAIAAIFALEKVIRGAAGFAAGGFVGAPGERGRDTVPAMLGRGEAVLNRHQQPYVEEALRRTWGFGLQSLFASQRRPHYLAAGGIAGLPPAPRAPLPPIRAHGESRALSNEIATAVAAAVAPMADEIRRLKATPGRVLITDHDKAHLREERRYTAPARLDDPRR